MHRLLATAIYAFAGLSAAQWGREFRWLHAPSETLQCGNVISDPFSVLTNYVGPVAAICAIGLAYRCQRRRRWHCYAITALVTFVVTSACLAYESHILRSEFGLDLNLIWWLPGR